MISWLGVLLSNTFALVFRDIGLSHEINIPNPTRLWSLAGFPCKMMQTPNLPRLPRESPTAPMSADADHKTPHIAPWLAIILRPIHTVFMRLFFRLKVTGQEHIPKTGPVILTPTHRSRWDPMMLPCSTMRLLRSLTSHDEFVGVQGWFMKRLGAFAVNTRRPSASTLKTCAEVLRKNHILVIYPEGSIFYYPPDQVHPLKPGTAWIAIKVQHEMPDVPLTVVPIRIRYSQLKPKFRTHAELAIQPPIHVGEFLNRPEKEAIRDLTLAIQSGMGDIVNPSTEEMITPRDPNAAPKRSYGRRG